MPAIIPITHIDSTPQMHHEKALAISYEMIFLQAIIEIIEIAAFTVIVLQNKEIELPNTCLLK